MATSTQTQTKISYIKHPKTITINPEHTLAPTHSLILTNSKDASSYLISHLPLARCTSLPRTAMRPTRSLGLR